MSFSGELDSTFPQSQKRDWTTVSSPVAVLTLRLTHRPSPGKLLSSSAYPNNQVTNFNLNGKEYLSKINQFDLPERFPNRK
jgi:hypothetical protein